MNRITVKSGLNRTSVILNGDEIKDLVGFSMTQEYGKPELFPTIEIQTHCKEFVTEIFGLIDFVKE